MGLKKRLLICFIVLLYSIQLTNAQTIQPIPYVETFDDTNFASRGWYDLPGGLVTVSSPSISGSALEIHYNPGVCIIGCPSTQNLTRFLPLAGIS